MNYNTRLLAAGLFYSIAGVFCIYMLMPSIVVLKTDDYILLNNNILNFIGFLCSILTFYRGLTYITKSIKK